MGRSTRIGRLRAAATGLGAGLALMGATDAFAATADGTNGTLTFTAAAGTSTNVSLLQDGTANVRIFRAPGDDDAITPTGTCTDAGPGDAFCTGITTVVAELGDRDDAFDAEGLTTITTTQRGGDGEDGLSGGDANDVLSGGPGSDFGLAGGAGDDTITGDDGDDFDLSGGTGNDSVSGGAGADSAFAGPGNDTVNGDAGDDSIDGGRGTDTVNGGDGDDFLRNTNFTEAGGTEEPDTGDVISGGSGFDVLQLAQVNVDAMDNATFPAITVTLDDVANDGIAGEGDNYRADVETVASSQGADVLTGNDATNQILGGGGNDTIDGGRGNDVTQAGDGDDTTNARDGFADVVTCGPGTDVANVDSLDTVSTDCETVNRVEVGNANEDRPPTLTVAGPGDSARIPTASATTYTATVADDRGVAQVLFLANGRIVCTDTAAPYTCAYQPTGADIGRTAITVVAIDSSQQTASATRSVTVGLFSARSFTSRVTPSRDARAPYRFTVTGRLTLPATVTAAQGCRPGVVSVQVKAGSRTISTRRATLSSTCTYRSTVVLRDRSRFRGARALKFTARFAGNTVVERRTASVKTARVR